MLGRGRLVSPQPGLTESEATGQPGAVRVGAANLSNLVPITSCRRSGRRAMWRASMPRGADPPSRRPAGTRPALLPVSRRERGPVLFLWAGAARPTPSSGGDGRLSRRCLSCAGANLPTQFSRGAGGNGRRGPQGPAVAEQAARDLGEGQVDAHRWKRDVSSVTAPLGAVRRRPSGGPSTSVAANGAPGGSTTITRAAAPAAVPPRHARPPPSATARRRSPLRRLHLTPARRGSGSTCNGRAGSGQRRCRAP